MTPFINTIPEHCRMCYTCVRECPAKAIRIVDGQAQVMAERCIACGNCVRVCSQHAKQVRSTIDQVRELIASDSKVAACIAPSFPAEFPDQNYRKTVGMVRALGFDYVHEVSFGADLVAREYKALLKNSDGQRFIATSCPAVVGFVERYYPGLINALAPIVSPMVAMARVLRELHGPEIKVVFIGPCIAKKVEANSPCVPDEIHASLTFLELRQMFIKAGLSPADVRQSQFDPPFGGPGSLFPIGRGMLQAAEINEDLMTGEVVATEGRLHVVEAIKEFASGDLGARLLEALCCHGCIMGPGISAKAPLFNRRRKVREYVCQRMSEMENGDWQKHMDQFASLDLSRKYLANDQRIAPPADHDMRQILNRLGKWTPDDELNCGACGYDTCRDHAVAIYKGLAENEMCLPFTIDQLRKTIHELADSNQQLASTQEALMHSEKLASMGQLAAGIAHEVNNPLGVVLMYAHLLLEECAAQDKSHEDLQMIVEQADRCKKIVAGLLHFARQNKVVRYPADISELVDRTLRTIQIDERVKVDVRHDVENPIAEVDRDQIVQVITNLITNALAAMEEGGTLGIHISGNEHDVQLAVSDTGVGIPDANIEKIFEPFFTTKQIGKGTGLGLAVTYGIVKMHCGDIRVESNADPDAGSTGTTFTVSLPRTE